MSFRGENGIVIDDAMLEEMAETWDNGEVPGFGGEIVRGHPRLSQEPFKTISFKVPLSMALIIEKAAIANGETRSHFLRDAAIEKANRVLADIA